jgi:hypothetical protein
MMPGSQNRVGGELLQRHPLLGNVKHQSLTAMYVFNSRGTVAVGVFPLVCKKALYRELTKESLLSEPKN